MYWKIPSSKTGMKWVLSATMALGLLKKLENSAFPGKKGRRWF
jgi:hypothetical protein